MKKQLFTAGLVAGLVIVAGAPTALADSRAGSSESNESAPYECGTGPGPDDPNDCTGGASTYTVTEHSNEVDCTDEGTADTGQGIVVSLNGEPSADTGWGEAEACNDGSTGPIQGRALAGGSFEHGGVYVTADGDNSNPEQAQGWVTVSVTQEPGVRCGDDAGNLDSTETTGADGQEDCPAPLGEG